MDFILPDREEIRQMNKLELEAFTKDIRHFLIDKVSKKGGHLASNLGMVELTVALWRVFNFPKDKVIFDVGHQSYTYKLLSGRKEGFDTLRELGGMSGFPKCNESPYDSFDTGHSSTSLSAGLGMVYARDLKKEKYQVVSVIGDGALTGGEAFEALDNVANLKSGYIMILNDNEMSISKNVGGIHKHLTNLRASKGYNRMKESVKNALKSSAYGEKVMRHIGNTKDSLKEIVIPSGMIFENLGIKYLGPVDGHNVLLLEKVLKQAVELNRPVLIHILTKKGKGYEYAEKKPSLYHGVGPFDPSTGVLQCAPVKPTYADLISDFLMENAESHPEICTVTAAMGDSVGFGAFRRKYPNRYFDVGIAEQHAVTFAAGLSKGGVHPYIALYSSFAQRAFDQLMHDVSMQKLPVTLLLDRAGLVGKDGETHQGAFDMAFLSTIPNLTVMAPMDAADFQKMLRFSLNFNGPLAIRYPRGEAFTALSDVEEPLSYGKGERIYETPREKGGKRVSLFAVGNMAKTGLQVAEALKNKGISSEVLNMRFIKPFDKALAESAFQTADLVVTLEDGTLSGGFGEHIAAYFANYTGGKTAKSVLTLGLPDEFIPQGSTGELFSTLSLDSEGVTTRILQYFEQSELQ